MGEILIVGGGIGGLACALTLGATGHSVHVMEATAEFGEIGAGIQLGPNGTRALAAIGVLPRVLDDAVFPRKLVHMDAQTGESVSALECGERIVARYGFPYLVVHRRDLHAALMEAAEAHGNIFLETSRPVTAVEDRIEKAAVMCADGSEYTADALVGADGLHSVVRRVISDDPLVESSYVAYRGTVAFSEVSSHAGSDNMVLWTGQDLHLVQYKLRGGELYNQVGVFRSERLGSDGELGTPDELDARFATCCELVRRSALLLNRDARWRMCDRESLSNWTQNRITLMGDAAHPMLQYLAQGGCQALEDAVVLARHVASAADIRAAFLAYQQERIPHTARVQATARIAGEAFHLGGVAAQFRNAVLSQRESADYRPFDWLYDQTGPLKESATLAFSERHA